MDIGLPLTLHVGGIILWIAGLFGVASTLVARDGQKDEAVRTWIAGVAKKGALWADIGATLAIVGGVLVLASNAAFYMHQPWMHAKLTLVLALLGLHGFLRVRVKRATQGNAAVFPAVMPVVVMALAWAIVALVVLKPGAH